MVDTIMAMPAGTVALVVRGKKSPSDEPGLLEQHADCILPDGSPIGFYGTGNDQSGNSIGLRMDGEVWDFAILSSRRVMYVDFASAVGYGAISTTLFVEVTAAQAKAFTASWATMRTSPGSFNIVGDNCSTHASKAFIEAGILKGGIPGLDTPDNLYKQLVKQLPGKTRSMSGYIGFIPKPGGGFDIKFREYVKAPTTAVTADRSWSSF
jgi:hypothetical protein